MLHVDDVTKRFGDLAVIDDFSMQLRRGGFTVLVGPSGCGKTSLFDLLCGVWPRDAGTLAWAGRTLPDLGGVTAYMQQKDLLLPWFSLLDNALLPRTVRGERGPAVREEARGLLGHFGLEGFAHYLPGQVSGGMRQRCALVRTLLFDRELVLLDEPLSALDAITRRRLQGYLLSLQSDYGRTLLMITHSIEEALLLGEEVLVLSGPPLRIIRRVAPASPRPRRIDDPELVALRRRIQCELEGGSAA
ncbi:MAG: ABC transporter ATP-binding protein [Synergistales bacterium]|nr:ABC transporter ATP-binding protein [Synergistales bacterium]